ncbi:MAG: glycine cleavage system aminomethyltransferase GcvT [Aquificota bacterium]|nr:glycine cleavage system aminomethyltransferase GcvT [Aquificota bacterium]
MRTPLYEIHRKRKARFTDFHGWDLPLQFRGIVEEVRAVRERAGVFDISHMGRILVRGKKALDILNGLLTNNLRKLEPGRVQYNLFTNEKGGVMDDVTVYMLSEEEFLICTNAVNREKIKRHLAEHLRVEDISPSTVQIALQGRESEGILCGLFDVRDIRYYRFRTFGDVLISRTGYTGEDGFEIYAPVKEGVEIYEELLRFAEPCGLGARDVLRIEAGFPLYGNEISEDITPLEANLDRFVDLSKEFPGKEEMLKRPLRRKLFGLELEEKGVPRRGYRILTGGREIGVVSSGTYSPTLRKGVALCFVDKTLRKEGLLVDLEVRGRLLKAQLRSYPFVRVRR